MRTFLKVVGVLLAVLVLVAIGGMVYITKALPNIAAPADMKVEMTPQQIERGAYLANHVSVCMDCHSTRDWSKVSGPLVPGTLGKGGEHFGPEMGFPGDFYARNLTPFHLKDWTDGEIYRAITSGVSKDGHPFFPVMPYGHYGKMATEDVKAIIAYLRTLPPVESQQPASEAEFPMSIILHTIPTGAKPMPLPDANDPRYGEYLTNAAACMECHTKQEKGKVTGQPFAGGFEFKFPNGGIVRSANITPDEKTGIGAWDKATFIRTFKQFADSSYVPLPADPTGEKYQTTMPWTMYGGMSEHDLGAIYDYLHAQPAVVNEVEFWTPAR